ncbi:MAG TPA: DMT family transporter [Thermoleophilia bacterium]|nr:DMT family transporter [Thermoleophilia bacterium]
MSGRTARAYAMVAASYLLIGLSGTLVTWATAPGSVLLVLRFVIATLAIGVVFGRRRRLVSLLDRGLWPRLLLMGALDAAALLLFFVAIRETGVAVGTFFLFIQPVWIALLAPRLLGSSTQRFVFVAIGLALCGLAILLVPAALGDSVHVSILGLVAGFGCGLSYAGFALVTKGLTRRMESIAMVLAECALDGLFLLPLALWQTLGTGYRLTSRDLIVALLLGLVVTAVGYTLWMEGMRWVRVQHSAVLGFLTPVAAPIYALIFLGQSITAWTVAGGALILAAGILVVLRGQGDLELEPPV